MNQQILCNSSFTQIQPISLALGAAVNHFSFAEPIHDKLWKNIYEAFLKYQVLIFRNQKLTPEQLITVARRFGSPVINDDFRPVTLKKHPEIVVLKNDGNTPPGADSWHTDQTASLTPSKITMLYGKTVPSLGGDTLFANTYTAYQKLSFPMRQVLAPLFALHDEKKAFGPEFKNIQDGLINKGVDLEKVLANKKAFSHPVVIRHPETKKECLYLSYPHVTGIKGMEKLESQAILNFLYHHLESHDLIYRHQWQPGDLVIWDNRCTQHLGVADYFPQLRLMHKITVQGRPLEPAYQG